MSPKNGPTCGTNRYYNVPPQSFGSWSDLPLKSGRWRAGLPWRRQCMDQLWAFLVNDQQEKSGNSDMNSVDLWSLQNLVKSREINIVISIITSIATDDVIYNVIMTYCNQHLITVQCYYDSLWHVATSILDYIIHKTYEWRISINQCNLLWSLLFAQWHQRHQWHHHLPCRLIASGATRSRWSSSTTAPLAARPCGCTTRRGNACEAGALGISYCNIHVHRMFMDFPL